MRNIFRNLQAFSLCCLLMPALSAMAELSYWKDLGVVEVNKQSPRTTFMSYANRASAEKSLRTDYFDYTQSPYFYLLNGTWKFYFVDAYDKLPATIHDPETSVAGWHDIEVPGNWELQGFGEAYYVNQPYEFAPAKPVPPLLPENNPVGVYRRDIEIPAGWLERDVYLHLAGAKSGVYVYLNGKEVGYSEDSKDPAEFLLNAYLKSGKNVLTLKIFRWSTGSWLECQDFLRISGIERDVFIWSQPKTAVQDFRIVSNLDNTYIDGIFGLGIDLKNTGNTDKNLTVRYELCDETGATVTSATKTVATKAQSTETLDFEYTLKNVKQWTAETPDLYNLYMTVSDGGKTVEVVPFRIGFRRVEITRSDFTFPNSNTKLNLLLVNGKPIKLKGTNIHETTEDGHYITPAQMRRNFELMKCNNINAVRLSHYPQDRKFYEMCDVYGIYVYDEANIESHGMYYTTYFDMREGAAGHETGGRGTLGNNPDFTKSHLSRLEAMFERNKNYPSVTIWSMGNEAGNGYNFAMGYGYLKEADRFIAARPVCYERALWEWNTDMYVPQYPSAERLEQMGLKGGNRNIPVVPSEYSHAMGNSNGNLWEQWEAIYKYPNLQGGFIWEWIDHAVKFNKNGREIWAYGGDFGKDQPSDGNFVADGIVNPNQIPHPAIAEVKYTHQNVAFEAEDLENGKVKIINRFYFTNLSGYSIQYAVLESTGLTLKHGSLNFNLAPQCDTILTLPITGIEAKAGVEYFLNFEVITRQTEKLVPAGHIVAYEQLRLFARRELKTQSAGKGPLLRVKESSENICITSPKVDFVFDKAKGVVTSYRVDGIEYFSEGFGIQPNFWRAPTDNDYGNGAPKRLQVWKEASQKFNVVKTTLTKQDNNVLLTAYYRLATDNYYIATYTVYPDGKVHAGFRFTSAENAAEQQADLSIEAREFTAEGSINVGQEQRSQQNVKLEIPRIGIRFRLPVKLNNVHYFGRGPEENYIDRNHGTMIGLYQSTAEEMYYPYVRPQENGHHTDTRWLALLNRENNKGLMVVADSAFGFNALRNSVEDFDCENSPEDYQWRNFSEWEITHRNYEGAKNSMRKQTHEADITPRNFVEVCVDMRQCGVAGYNSWGARPLPEYSLFADREYSWGFTLMPAGNGAMWLRHKK